MAAPAPTGDQAKSMFDQGLSQMAYSVLITKLPSISQDVVTFKILESDPEAGSGVGAFVLMRRGQTIYVPVVMAENQIKPLDILYFKDLNVFLPLTKEWLEELDKLSLDELGNGVKQPQTLSTDVDIRNTVVPPTTGRYSYASENEKQELAVKLAGCVFDAAKDQQEPKQLYLHFLSRSPDAVKLAVARVYEQNKPLLKLAVKHYGKEALLNALKVADYGGKVPLKGGALYIADKNTTPGEFKDIFGPKAPLAFQGVAVKGYYAKDDRKELNRPVQVQVFRDLHEPKDAGAYRLWGLDGKPTLALIIGNPINLFADTQGKRVTPRNVHSKTKNDLLAQGENTLRLPHVDRYVGITEDGKLIDTSRLIGEQVAMSELEGSKVYKATVGDTAAAGPRKGQFGIFVQRRGASFVATTPLWIEAVSESDGKKMIEVLGAGGKKTLLLNPKSSLSKLVVPAHSHVVYLPADFVFLQAKGEVTTSDFFSNPKDILHWTLDALHKEGAERVIVRKPYGDSSWLIDRQPVNFVDGLRKLATEKNISVEDAEAALKQAEELGVFEFFVLSPAKYEKVAAHLKVAEGDSKPPKKKDSGAGGDPAAQDPAQAAMDQMAMAQAAQQPQPVDMAVAEQMQNIQGQMLALQQQMQLLNNIQQRTQQIATGGGAAGNPAAMAAAMAGPMDPSMMGAGQPVGAQAPAAPPMQPGMAQQLTPMQGAPPVQGQQPPQQSPVMGAAAPQQGMGQMGMDPNAAMQQQGMDPSQQQQQPPMAMMNADDGTVESLMQQVNPSFMEQAGQLNDAGVFDAASLATMAQTPQLKDLVAAYIPNLEKSLDNIGRVLLSLWMDESNIKGDVGNETFIALEDNLRNVFKGMGDLILKINQQSLVIKGPTENAGQE
jgi:hypothetical protein